MIAIGSRLDDPKDAIDHKIAQTETTGIWRKLHLIVDIIIVLAMTGIVSAQHQHADAIADMMKINVALADLNGTQTEAIANLQSRLTVLEQGAKP